MDNLLADLKEMIPSPKGEKDPLALGVGIVIVFLLGVYLLAKFFGLI